MDDESVFDGPGLDSIRDDIRLRNMLQRCYEALKTARGRVIPVPILRRFGSSADARCRDLRKPRFGGFSVPLIEISADRGLYGYALDPESITPAAEALVYAPRRDDERDTIVCPRCGGAGRVTADIETTRREQPATSAVGDIIGLRRRTV